MGERRIGGRLRLLLLLVAVYASSLASPQDPEQRDLILLARSAVISAVLHEPLPVMAKNSPPKPVFVTIEENGNVLGCRGDLVTRAGSLQNEVIAAATSAAHFDPRHKSLVKKDLGHFLVTVTIVESVQPLGDIQTLSPQDGLIVENGQAQGVVLPLEGREPALRLRWGYKKAGLAYGSPAGIYRLVGERFRG